MIAVVGPGRTDFPVPMVGTVLIAVIIALLVWRLALSRRLGGGGWIAAIVGICAMCAMAFLFMPAGRSHAPRAPWVVASPKSGTNRATIESPVRVPGAGVSFALAQPCDDCDDCDDCDSTELVVETHEYHGPYTSPSNRHQVVGRSASAGTADVQSEPGEYRISRTRETSVVIQGEGPVAPRPPAPVRATSPRAPWQRGAAYERGRALPVSWPVVSAAALAAMIYLAYLFLDAGTRGQFTWLLRLFSVVAFLAICGFLVLYGRGL